MLPTPFGAFLEGLPEDYEKRKSWVKGDQLVLPNLPVGKYVLRLHSSAEILEAIKNPSTLALRYPGWQSTEVSFEVKESTAPELIAAQLNIEIDQ